MSTKNNNYQGNSISGLKILVIDDDVQLCDSIRFYLEDNDCDVTVAYDGNKGNELIDSQIFDLIYVDLNMPKVDGHNVIEYSTRCYPETPIIVISGTGEIQNVIRAIQLGAWDFVTKPILDFNVLDLSVHRAIEKVHINKERKNYKDNLEEEVFKRTKELELKANELKKINDELDKAKLEAEKSDRLKSEFLTQISHEIRTPLNVILSYVSIMIDELNQLTRDEIEQGADVIRRSSKRLIRTIELLLNMSELEIGSFRLIKQEIDLVEIIETIVNEYKILNKNNKLRIVFNSELKSLITISDYHSVYQIITNLIDNAVKFTPAGKVLVKLEQCDSHGKIEIQDTGIGIAEDYMPHIFDPFSQEEQGYTRSYEGNGLGLSVTKKYCDLNEISISICSKKTEGTKVELNFNNNQN